MSAPNIINELEEALADGSAERRAKTLHRITDLFAFGSGHFSKDHIALFDGVFNHLISVIEVSARAALAERLAAMPNAPPAAIRTLAFDDAIDVAGPVLSKSEQLDNATLVENANAKSQKHLLAISRRKSIAETVTDVLVERGDREVALTATRNAGAKFSEAGYVRLVRRSAGDDELTQSVGSRPEIPRHHFLKLLNAASHTVRLALEAAHPQSANDIQRVVGEAATAVQARVAAESHDYAVARALVEKMRAAKQLGENSIETFARAGKFEETVAALAVMCRLSIEIVERAMVQDRVETVLIVAKSIGLSWPTVKAILLLRAGTRGISKHTLEEHMVSYTHLKPETAQRVVEFQRRR
ncbi:MAG: DUF2336 domain-containing protein [Gallionella sp.]